MTYWSEKRLRNVGWALALLHSAAFAIGFVVGHYLQKEPHTSAARAFWYPIEDVAWQVAVYCAGITGAWWIYLAIRRQPGAVLYALFWLLWFAVLALSLSVAPPFSGVPVGA